MEPTHAIYSPSKLPRIIECPASGLYDSANDSASTNQYADDGTNLHSATKEHLDNNEYTVDPVLATKYALDQSRIDAVQECLDYVFALRQSYMQNRIPFYDFVETHVSLAGWIPNTGCDELNEVSGTLDYGLIARPQHGPKVLHITDWKFGQGIEVFPDSEQLMAYALGALKDEHTARTFDEVHLTIMQPRLTSEDHLKTIMMTPNDLFNWLGSTLVPALRGVHAKHPIFRPSIKACRWCPIKMTCTARRDLVQQIAVDVFTAHETLPTPDMDFILSVYKQSGILKDYISDISEYLYNELIRGREVPGYKLVEGKANRQWSDEQAAIQWCANNNVDPEKMFVSKFFSPAQAEKVIGAKLKKDPSFYSLVVKPAGKPTLVPETDKRTAIEYRSAAEIFATVDFPDEI